MTSRSWNGPAVLAGADSAFPRSPDARDRGQRTDREIADAVVAGDEAAFLALVKRWHGSMVRVARCYVASEGLAEEVARCAWGSVLEELALRDPRNSLASFLLGVVAREARARAALDLSTPEHEGEDAGPSAETDPSGGLAACEDVAGEGSGAPLDSAESLAALRSAVDRLPRMERIVFTVRDIAGCGADEAGAVLDLPEPRQRALLHRARSRLHVAMQSRLLRRRGEGREDLRGAL